MKDYKVIVLVCRTILGKQENLNDFEIIEIKKAKSQDFLGLNIIAVLYLGKNIDKQLVLDLSSRMLCRTKNSLTLKQDGTWMTLL